MVLAGFMKCIARMIIDSCSSLFPESKKLQCLIQNPLQPVQKHVRKGRICEQSGIKTFQVPEVQNHILKLTELCCHSLNITQGNAQEKCTKLVIPLD